MQWRALARGQQKWTPSQQPSLKSSTPSFLPIAEPHRRKTVRPVRLFFCRSRPKNRPHLHKGWADTEPLQVWENPKGLESPALNKDLGADTVHHRAGKVDAKRHLSGYKGVRFKSHAKPRRKVAGCSCFSRFLRMFLLPKLRSDYAASRHVNVHHYMSLKKAIYKPTAFFKGIVLPLCEVAPLPHHVEP